MRNNPVGKWLFVAALLAALVSSAGSQAQDPGLTVREIMQSIITPMTNTLWGAYQVETDAQWQELANAANTLVGAGTLLMATGPDAGNADWQEYNGQMIAAARAALAAIGKRDEEALSTAGNDLLYPPCESCHQRYMGQ